MNLVKIYQFIRFIDKIYTYDPVYSFYLTGILAVGVILGIKKNLFVRFFKWIRSFESTYIPLVFLWLLGIGFGFIEFVKRLPQMVSKEDAGVFVTPFILIIVMQLLAGLVHQLIVFRCIHAFDTNKPKWTNELPNWIGTDTEWILRAIILLFLLTVGGEIPLLCKHVVDSVNHCNYLIPLYIYPLSSVFLCISLLGWDLYAIKRNPQNNHKNFWNLFYLGSPSYIQQFFFSDLLCFLFWLAIFSCALTMRIGPVTFIIALLTALPFFVIIFYRLLNQVGLVKGQKIE